jgi:hypothetical protein
MHFESGAKCFAALKVIPNYFHELVALEQRWAIRGTWWPQRAFVPW